MSGPFSSDRRPAIKAVQMQDAARDGDHHSLGAV